MFWKKKKEVSFDVVDSRGEDGHCFISGKVGVVGEVYFAGTLRIDGRIDGKVSVYDGKTGTLVLSKDAVVNGPVAVTNMIIDGMVTGEVEVEKKLECRSHAVIKGDVTYGVLNILDGARLQGKCEVRATKLSKVPSSNSTGENKPTTLATRNIAYLKKNG
jgi:cytoskeletal protein CcmA (bactofilin family)